MLYLVAVRRHIWHSVSFAWVPRPQSALLNLRTLGSLVWLRGTEARPHRWEGSAMTFSGNSASHHGPW